MKIQVKMQGKWEDLEVINSPESHFYTIELWELEAFEDIRKVDECECATEGICCWCVKPTKPKIEELDKPNRHYIQFTQVHDKINEIIRYINK